MSGFTVNSRHPVDLASGRIVAPSQELRASAVDQKSDHDRRLIDEGVLVAKPDKKRSGANEKEKS